MSDEQYALSPAPSSPPPTEADYEAIFAAVMETVRGRWFLSEFARRNRHADTQMVLAAIDRLQATVHGEHADPTFERIRTDIRDMADAIAATRREIAAIRPDREHTGIGEATEELDAIVMATERATSEILAAAETIQEMAWTLREQGLEAKICDKLDACATDVYLACSFQDLTGQRTRKVIHVLRYLEERINAMVEILGGEAETAPEQPARVHDPLDIAMDQAEIDAVMPAAPAERAEAAQPSPQSQSDAMTAVLPTVMEASALLDVAPIGGPTSLEEPTAATVDPAIMNAEAVLDLDAEPVPPPAQADGTIEGDVAPDFADTPASQTDDVLARPTDAGDEVIEATSPADSLEDGTVDALTAPPGLDHAEQATVGVDAQAMPPETETDHAPDAPQEFVRGVAPNTASLLADLLAIIRPASETDADAGREQSLNALASALDVADPSIQAMAEYTRPEPLDLRLLQPITPPSDFVIVPLAPGSSMPAAAVETDAPAAVVPTTMFAEAAPPAGELTEALPSEPSGLAEIADERPVGALSDDAPPAEAMATRAMTDSVGFVETAEADTAQEILADILPEADHPVDVLDVPEPTQILASVEVAELPPTSLSAHPEISPEEIGADRVGELGTIEPGQADAASEPDTAPAEAEPTGAIGPETIGVVGLDDDLLMAPVESPAPGSPATDSVTHADMDLLLPVAAAPAMETVPAANADTAGTDKPAAPDKETAGPDMTDAEASPDSFAEETAAKEPEETAPAVVMTDEPPSPAADQAPLPPAYAAAFLDEGSGGQRATANERAAALELAPPPAAAVTPFNASATAALAVLAMSATADTGSVETVRHEVVGHIDPLAAVKALSAEERIALFS
jgi:chemotaxis regulatin CheY-phosphate phosphatase CheZ